MNLQVPPELEVNLTRPAAETGRTADQVAVDLLASSVDHDEWFRARRSRSSDVQVAFQAHERRVFQYVVLKDVTSC